MKRIFVRLAVSAAVIVPLGACGDSNNRDPVEVIPPPVATPAPTPAPPPPPGIGSIESFGAAFASVFRTAADTEPRDAGEGDLPPISFTTEPAEPTGF